MDFFGIEIFAAIGFLFAAYAVVGNDALQTLGTFINSNKRLHWSVLFAFAAGVLVITFAYGWVVNGGDPSYGRLSNESKYPPINVEWYHILPPLVLLVITRLGIPVSTSFMVLTIFASIGGLGSMIEKSLFGYALAFATGGVVYLIITRTLEKWFEENPVDAVIPYGLIAIVGSAFFLSQYYVFGTTDSLASALIGVVISVVCEIIAIAFCLMHSRSMYWVIVQWVTTGYLWAVWLIQDFANIFVFLPREITAVQGFIAMGGIVLLLGYTFANQGGPVQRILKTKSNVTDIRSATIIDFLYATLLFFFKELNDLPMSTTWVFLGLIAGREYAFALTHKVVTLGAAVLDTFSDLGKAFIGLVISVDLAVGLPLLAQIAIGEAPEMTQVFTSHLFLWFVILSNLMLAATIWFLMKKDKPAATVFIAVMALGAAAFFMTVDQLEDGAHDTVIPQAEATAAAE
ncbi:hypothetical protein [Ponticaulis sp.]|uniref:hypothetical protein n=1 Tax=Ponticaulis sp. TaxID=2020902 RepID=UPI0025CCB208|nr:hypothetical protein [Ponticaulis sp.]|tara:strand:+ start:103278 stop:104654 length:1377 start_codon:yes stop_codon:yes gene_type:complete